MIMAITEPMLPMIIIPLVFLFVLLIILINKAPKAGAWVVGGVILLAPILLYRLAMAGAGSEEVLPVVIMPASFIFVLLMVVLAKAPKVGAGLVVALVVMTVVGFFFALPVSHRRGGESSPVLEMRQSGDAGTGLSIVRDDLEAVHLEVSKMSSGLKQVIPPAPVLPAPAPAPAPSPIWSEGVDQQFEADVYPSKVGAVRAAGQRLGKSIQALIRDPNSQPHVVIFQQGQDYGLVAELRDVVKRMLPDVSCAIEAERRNTAPQELAVTLRCADLDAHPAPWAQSDETKVTSGRMDVDLTTGSGTTHIPARFAEKPWVENFAAFTSIRPEQHFIVTRSRETCTSESEARQQALEDARARLLDALGRRAEPKLASLPAPSVTTTDVLEGGFVVDQFAQSFDGSAGKIWRQALLIDVAGSKLLQLAEQKAREAHSMRMSWARMGLSVVGVLVLIGAIYFFLNMATMGYYEWSLRVAGIVLAIIAIISILMIVQ